MTVSISYLRPSRPYLLRGTTNSFKKKKRDERREKTAQRKETWTAAIFIIEPAFLPSLIIHSQFKQAMPMAEPHP